MNNQKIKTPLFKFVKVVSKPLKGKDLNRFWLVRFTTNIILRHFKPKYIKIGRDNLILDRDDSLRLSVLGTYEPFMTKLFKKRIKRGDTVLDIGAHIGYYTLIAAQKVGVKGKVIAFEPENDNFNLLSRNIHNNKHNSVQLVNKAVTNKSGTINLYLNKLNAGHHSTVHNFHAKETTVDGISLDDFFVKATPKISVIKMDIEGGEYNAFCGMEKLLRANKNLTLFTELWSLGLKSAKKSPSVYVNLLRRLGFVLYIIDEYKEMLEPLNIQKLLPSQRKNLDWHINILGIKKF